MLRSRTQRLVAAGLVLLVALGVAGWWFFIRDDAPEEASIDDASQTLEEEGGSDDQGTESSDDVNGTWTIDSTIGSFDDFSSTYAGYRIQEELATIGAAEAVGRTPQVTGSITIVEDQVTEGSFEVDMTTLQSDEDRRDNALRTRGLETDSFPTATFTLSEPIDLPAEASSGDQFTVTATGELTLHGVTNPVTIDLDAQLRNGIIALVGSAPVALADYDIEPPEGLSVISVADSGTFEFQLFLTQE